MTGLEEWRGIERVPALRSRSVRGLTPMYSAASPSVSTLRYSFATLGLLAGELDKTVSAQMGHASVDFTKAVYAKVLPEMTQRLSDRLERHLFSDGRTPLAHSEVAGEM